jgi:hypothetical protein
MQISINELHASQRSEGAKRSKILFGREIRIVLFSCLASYYLGYNDDLKRFDGLLRDCQSKGG